MAMLGIRRIEVTSKGKIQEADGGCTILRRCGEKGSKMAGNLEVSGIQDHAGK